MSGREWAVESGARGSLPSNSSRGPLHPTRTSTVLIPLEALLPLITYALPQVVCPTCTLTRSCSHHYRSAHKVLRIIEMFVSGVVVGGRRYRTTKVFDGLPTSRRLPSRPVGSSQLPHSITNPSSGEESSVRTAISTARRQTGRGKGTGVEGRRGWAGKWAPENTS